MNRLSVTLLASTLFLLQTQGGQAAETSGACDLSKMKKWTALGTRWALGSDAGGKPLAIYDLSFSALDRSTELGKVGGPKPDPKELAQELTATRQYAFETAEEAKQTDQAIANLLKDAALTESFAYDGTRDDQDAWLKQIPWKPSFAFDGSNKYESFTLDDIDIESTVQDVESYHRDVAQIEQDFVEAGEGPVRMRDIYRHMKFNRSADGSYDITFEGTDNPSGLRKIGGIACVRDVRFTARLWGLVNTLFSQIVQRIVNSSVNSVFATAMNRYTHYQKLKLDTHLDMLIEALVAADRGESLSPLAQLSEADRNNLKISVLLAKDSGIASLRRIFRSPQSEWASFVATEATRTSDALAFIQRSGIGYTPLNPRFGIETLGGDQRVALLSLPRASSSKHGAYVSYSYVNPDQIRIKRLWTEAEIVAVDFASRFIPLWGFLVRAANERILQTPMDTQKRWEARLTEVLEERERTIASEANAWESELQTLDRQRINPLELSRPAMLSRVAAIKARLGLAGGVNSSLITTR